MAELDAQAKAELVAAWIAAQESEQYSAAVQALIELPHDDPELCWELVQLIHSRDISDDVRGSLAAGPLEDLLVYHPLQFFPRVKALAEHDSRFRSMLAGVWLDGNDSPIWQEFYAVAGVQPQFPPGWNKA